MRIMNEEDVREGCTPDGSAIVNGRRVAITAQGQKLTGRTTRPKRRGGLTTEGFKRRKALEAAEALDDYLSFGR